MDNLLENKYIVSAAAVFLVTSTGLLKPILSEELLNNPLVKNAIIFGIFYMSNENVTLSILLTVAYLTTLRIFDNVNDLQTIEKTVDADVNTIEDVEQDVHVVDEDGEHDVHVAEEDVHVAEEDVEQDLNGAEEDISHNEVQEEVVAEEPAEGETEVEEAVNEAVAVEAAGDGCNCEKCEECEECEECEDCDKPKEEKEYNVADFEVETSFEPVSNMTGRTEEQLLPQPFENNDVIKGIISDHNTEFNESF